MKLLGFLRHKFPEYSVKALKRAIDAKQCRVNGKIERISTREINPHDRVELNMSFALPPPNVLYEDAFLVALNKPAGILSESLQDKKLLLIHRLDKETSGVLLLAKTSNVLEKMIELFRTKQVHKLYLALVDGFVQKKEGTIESFLAKKGMKHGQSVWGSVKSGREKAVTRWVCLAKSKQASLLECTLVTGKTHQLRVHLSEMGHPILGDLVYGKSFTCPLEPARHLLHAVAISFCHPHTKKEIEIKAPLPEDFLQAKKALRL